jgi:outer membrane protein assembly factor BamB
MARRVFHFLSIAALLAPLASCQSVTDQYNRLVHGGTPAQPPAPLVAIQATAKPAIVWQGSVGSGDKEVFFPAPSGNIVFAAGASGQIVGFDAVKGGAISRLDAGQRLSGGVGIGGGMILAGTPKGEVLAFDAQGKALWRAQLTSEVLAPPVAADGVVIARSGDGRLYGLDATDGRRRWIYQRPTSVPLTVRTHVGFIVHRGAIFAGFPGGRLVALSAANGGVGWEGVVAIPRGATELERVSDVTSLPVTDDQRICAVAFQGRVACFDLNTGTALWSRDASSIAGLTLDPRYLYLTDDKNAVLAFDKTSGASIWKQDKLTGRRVTAPLAFGRFVIVGDFEGYVHLLSREDGSFAARIATDGSAIGAPPIQIDLTSFLVQTRKGGVFAINVQ